MQSMQKQPWYNNRFWGSVRHSFLRSNWITAIWNWFLGLAGKAAEAVLTASVIYACARLLPGVHLSSEVDNSVFIAQMVALDVGGLSLRKMASQARKDGNEEGAQLASKVSTALISIMIANVALSVVQSITPISAQVVAVIEGILLIARAIMAVVYAYVIHSLRTEPDQVPPPAQSLLSLDYWPLIGISAYLQQEMTQALAHVQAQFDQRLGELAGNQARMIAEFSASTDQRIAEISFPVVDTQVIAGAVLASLEDRFNREMKHLQADLKQQVTIWQTDKTFAIDAPKRSMKQGVKHSSEAPDNVLKLHAKTTSPEDTDALIIRLYHEDTSRSHRKIANLTGIPEATVYRKLKRYLETLAESETPPDEKGEAFGSA